MLSILADRTYRHLFAAQVVALLGTGLATVALSLLAYDLAGGRAGLASSSSSCSSSWSSSRARRSERTP